MSYNLSLYRFVDGELAPPEMDMVRSFLAPYHADSGKVTDADLEFWIRASDGSEAELDVSGGVVGVDRPQSGDVWRIIIDLADRIGSVLIPDGTLLCREEMREHLPDGMADDAVFVPEINLEVFERVAGPFTHPLT